MIWKEMQKTLHHWRTRNFPTADAIQQLLGVSEEVGELSHCHLKEMQGIRGTAETHQLGAQDAVGDTVIYLLGYCSYRGWDFEEIVENTCAHILKRNWIDDPIKGEPYSKTLRNTDDPNYKRLSN